MVQTAVGNEERQALVVALADIEDEKIRERAITESAMKFGGNFTQESRHLSDEVNAYLAQHKDVGPSENVKQFNTPVGGLQVNGAVSLNQDGKFAGTATSVQTGVMDNAYGAASVGVATAQNEKGKLTSVAPYAKYVGPAFGTEPSSPVAGVPIAAMTANIPMSGEFKPEHVDMTVGVAAWHKASGVSSITTVTTDAAGSKVVVGENISGNVYEGGAVKVALNAGASHDFVNNQTNASTGVLVRADLNAHAQLYAGLNATMSDIGGANAPGVNAQIGVNFDFNDKSPASAKTTSAQVIQVSQQEANAAAQNVMNSINQTPYREQVTSAHPSGKVGSHTTPNVVTEQHGARSLTTIMPSVNDEQVSVRAKLEKFYELPHETQRKIVNHMADKYVTQHPEISPKQAQEIVLEGILNPQTNQEVEQVATR